MGSGPLNIAMFVFMQESNHPTILERKTKLLKKELGRNDLHSHLEMRLPPRGVLTKSIVRPVKVYIRSLHWKFTLTNVSVSLQIAYCLLDFVIC